MKFYERNPEYNAYAYSRSVSYEKPQLEISLAEGESLREGIRYRDGTGNAIFQFLGEWENEVSMAGNKNQARRSVHGELARQLLTVAREGSTGFMTRVDGSYIPIPAELRLSLASLWDQVTTEAGKSALGGVGLEVTPVTPQVGTEFPAPQAEYGTDVPHSQIDALDNMFAAPVEGSPKHRR